LTVEQSTQDRKQELFVFIKLKEVVITPNKMINIYHMASYISNNTKLIPNTSFIASDIILGSINQSIYTKRNHSEQCKINIFIILRGTVLQDK
jgi:hypothetical protein